MRLLHTADWHLGQNFHGYSRQTEHQQFLDWLLDTLDRERIDVLLIAGDIFDTANPPAAAQQQLYRFLCEAKRRRPGLQGVLVAGNHDSPGRLEVPVPFLDVMDVRVVGAVRREDGEIDPDSLIVPLRNPSGDTAAYCLAVPFLRPADVPRVETDGDAYLEGIRALYSQVTERALALRQPGQALVALGHCHLVGGQESTESERRLVIGGVEALSASTFAPELAYVGLGHLHLAQRVGEERIRYSGSPLPMSFSEIDYPHQVLVTELAGEALASVTPVRIPRFVPLLKVPAQPAPPDAVLAELTRADWPPCEPDQQPYLQVRVALERPEPGLRHRIEQALEGKGVRLVRIETVYPGKTDESGERTDIPESAPARLDPEDVFRRLWGKSWAGEPDAEVLAAFRDLLSSVGTEEAP